MRSRSMNMGAEFGYIILDRDTGSEAYLIDGGGNGGWLSLAAEALEVLVILAIGVLAASIWGVFKGAVAIVGIKFVSAAIAMAAVVWFVVEIFDDYNYDDLKISCRILWIIKNFGEIHSRGGAV